MDFHGFPNLKPEAVVNFPAVINLEGPAPGPCAGTGSFGTANSGACNSCTVRRSPASQLGAAGAGAVAPR